LCPRGIAPLIDCLEFVMDGATKLIQKVKVSGTATQK